jgi:uncharacterized protein YeaO (DUF488 family)
MIRIKRVYDKPAKTDGYRVLVDRLWPRGVRKTQLSFDAWEKELAPSDRLRREFGHDPELWPRFRSDYRKELRSGAAREKVRSIAELARRRNVTLLYSARDEEHNNAVVLRGLIESAIERGQSRGVG